MGNELYNEIPVNDGKGFYDNEGLIDTLIADLNNLTKALVSGQFIQYSGVILQMYQKLNNLKVGIVRDRKSLEKQIEDLQRFASELSVDTTGEGGAA